MVAALVLAAGTSSRFGANKLLLPFGDATVVATTVANVLSSRARPVLVVTGHEQPAVTQALAGLPVLFDHNPDFQAGEMLSSIKVGLRGLMRDSAAPDGVLIVLADQPLTPPSVLDRIITAFEFGCGSIIAPRFRHDGPRGHPVLISQRWWPDVLALPPGANVRDLLKARPSAVAHLAVNTDAILRDVDTPEAYREAVLCWTQRPSNF